MQDLPFHTLTQFVALGLTLIAGWLLGLASSSGGRKWRERYYDEEVNNAGYRDRAESDLRDAARRIRDLEAENARLRADMPAAVHAPVPVVAADPAPASAAEVEHHHHDHGHSTATVAGAALVGAAAGAAVHAAHERHENHEDPSHREPVAASHAQPAHATSDHDRGEGARASAPDAHDGHDHAPADGHHH